MVESENKERKKKQNQKTHVEEQTGIIKIAHTLHHAPGTLLRGVCRDTGADPALAGAFSAALLRDFAAPLLL